MCELLFFTLGYLSPRSLRECNELRSVTYYTLEMIEKGESLKGFVAGSTEKTVDVLVAGADTHFIKNQGMDCDYKWILQETKTNLELEMNPNYATSTLKADYHSLASLLKVPEKEYSGKEKPTDFIIRHWCDNRRKRMTFGMLYTLLKHPGIIGNQEAARVLEDMVETHVHQVNE